MNAAFVVMNKRVIWDNKISKAVTKLMRDFISC